MPDHPALQRGVSGWGIAVWVLAGAIVIVSLYVAMRIYCWYGCVAPFDETWQRRMEAAAIARQEAASLDDGERQIVALPDEYSDLSETGEATVERGDGELMVILIQRNAFAGDSAMVHAPSGVAERGRFLDEYCISGVYSQGASWYEVRLNDYLPVLGPCR
ncbi:MAG: hypothetical protein ABIZ57_03955 [Candidatus Limnocylindria bacterium]